MEADWVREIRDNCLQHKVPFFFKQWGGVFKKRTGRTLDNQVWNQMPDMERWVGRSIPEPCPTTALDPGSSPG